MLCQLSTKPQSWLPEEKIFFGVNMDRARYGANIRYCTHPRNNEMGTITVSDKLGPSSKVSNVRYFQSVPSNEVTTFYAVLPTLLQKIIQKLGLNFPIFGAEKAIS